MSTLGSLDVAHVFVHDATVLLKNIPQAFRPQDYQEYDQRALLMARPHDVVCVSSPKLDPDYVRFLRELEVAPHRENIVEVNAGFGKEESSLLESLCRCPVSMGRIGERLQPAGHVVLNSYFISDEIHVWARKLEIVWKRPVMVLGGPPAIAASVNLKHLAFQQAQALGIPVASGEVVEGSPGCRSLRSALHSVMFRYAAKTGEVIIRGADGISGSATLTVDFKNETWEREVDDFFQTTHSSIFLVQVRHSIIVSPNILVFVHPDNGGAVVVGVSDQRLTLHLKHTGNTVPSTASTLPGMIRSAEVFARWMGTAGFSGLVGFDFVEYVDPRTRESRYLLAEVNARANGAAYPAFLMDHLNARQRSLHLPTVEAYLSTRIPFSATSFAEFRSAYGSMLFNPRTGRGIFPYAISQRTLSCKMAFLGSSRHDVEAMYEGFTSSHREVVEDAG